MSPPSLEAIAAHLAGPTDAARYAERGDPAGVWLPSGRPVRRLGLALEAGKPPYAWAEGLDAVLIHRPFGLWPAKLPEGVGVLAYHAALDDRYSTGLNPDLSAALGLTPDDEPLRRDGQPIGFVGRLPEPVEVRELFSRVREQFGGIAGVWGAPMGTAQAMVHANAMTEPLVRDAAERGAGLYLTGQLRKPARQAVFDTGIVAVEVGQGRTEWWGLRRLGRLVQARWPEVEIVEIAPPE
jgi:putative NIF3 family GTP cyclohydrolase 1 type 2